MQVGHSTVNCCPNGFITLECIVSSLLMNSRSNSSMRNVCTSTYYLSLYDMPMVGTERQ